MATTTSTRRNSFGLLTCLLLIVVMGIAASPLYAQGAGADEYDIRAAMLVNITRFVDWPSHKIDAQHPQISICIAGSDPIGPSLDHFLQQQSAAAKTMKVRHLNSIETATSCDVLYVGVREQKDLKRVGAELAKAGVLVISEGSNAGNPNQIIGLPTVDEHIHIEVNLGLAKLAGLTISSKLLRLATVTQ